MAVTVDASEVHQLATDLRGVSSRLSRKVQPVVAKGALNIKNDLQAQMRRSTHFRPIARGISYDTKTTSGGYEAEIGPVKGSPGSLANIAYFGDSLGAGTVEDPQAALDREGPAFADAIAAVAAELALGR